VAKTDYAINGGDRMIPSTPLDGGNPLDSCLGPGGGLAGDAVRGMYPNCNWHCGDGCIQGIKNEFSGISTWRYSAKVSQITDGTDKTLMIGEKSVLPFFYEKVGGFNRGDRGFKYAKENHGDNSSMYQGYDYDQTRWDVPILDADKEVKRHKSHFGSAHLTGTNVMLCDGAIKTIDFDIDRRTWTRLVDRDGDGT